MIDTEAGIGVENIHQYVFSKKVNDLYYFQKVKNF